MYTAHLCIPPTVKPDSPTCVEANYKHPHRSLCARDLCKLGKPLTTTGELASVSAYCKGNRRGCVLPKVVDDDVPNGLLSSVLQDQLHQRKAWPTVTTHETLTR